MCVKGELQMEKLLEKIKNLDKRVLIGAGIGAAVLVIVIIAVAVGSGESSNQKNPQNGTQNNTEMNQDVTGTEDATGDITEVVTEEDENNDATQNGTVDGNEQQPEQGSDSGNQEEPGNNSTGGTNGGQSQTEPVKPEDILGDGDKSDPYLEILREDNTVQTVEIAAGKSAYYGVYRVGGMNLTIEDANAYVIYEGKKYEASNGMVSLQIGNALASEAVMFEIGNKGSAPASFTLKFSNLYGSFANPEHISSIASQSKSLAKGNESGHYYKYVAEKTGTIRFYIDSATNECEMSVTDNNTSLNRTFEDETMTDANGKAYIELAVTQGDVIMIQIYAKPDKRWNYPATDVTWHGEYV